MSRLQSFNAPSTPHRAPVPHQAASARPPAAPAESAVHRRLRALLAELRTAAATWDELVLHDGIRAAKAIVDARTELDNALALLPKGTLPRQRLVTPKIVLMDAKAADLQGVLVKLKKQFNKIVSVADNLDALVTEAHKQKGWHWVHTEPLWSTWTLDKFALEIPLLLPYYDRALRQHTLLANTLVAYSTPFDDARTALAQWIAQPELQDCPWPDWEELFDVEVDKWQALSR